VAEGKTPRRSVRKFKNEKRGYEREDPPKRKLKFQSSKMKANREWQEIALLIPTKEVGHAGRESDIAKKEGTGVG